MTPLERAARALWVSRELMQPERCRMRWEDGTALARETATLQARAVVLSLLAPNRITLRQEDGTPIHFDDVLGAILEQDA